MATAAGNGITPLRAGGLRPWRAADGAGGATSVLARTASGDVQPSAWLAAWVAAGIRSGAGTIFADAAAAGAGGAAAGPWAWAWAGAGGGMGLVLSAGTGSGRNSSLSITRPC